ncbi:MAG: hypothetical protein RLZZ591_2645 [Pseudomonadota bacterium]|jgi:HlyD family secretion protein
MSHKNTWGMVVVVALLIAALAWAFAPRPLEVEVATVIQAPFEQFIEEDGRTQVRERYTVSAPLAARLQRISLHVGDPVAAGDVVAWLLPVMPTLQDQRSARENLAKVAAAGAGVERATARVERAAISLQENWLELQRQGRLEAQGFVSSARLDALRLAVSGASRDLDAAAAERDAALFEQDRARAAASPGTPEKQADKPLQVNPDGSRAWAVRAPVAGVVLKVSQPSDNVVAPGQALLDIGDPGSLEVVCELLTPDAAVVQPGQRVLIERWGGPTQTAAVRRVEPAAFTKVSALGVEEQRVKVLIDLPTGHDAAETAQLLRLGDAYRVGVRIVTQSQAAAVQVPVGAVFSRGTGLAVYLLESGRVHRQTIELGGRQGSMAWVLSGLTPGQQVVVYPGAGLQDGNKVRVRTP